MSKTIPIPHTRGWWALHKGRTITGIYYALMLEYRAEIFLWALASVLPLVLMGVWVKAARNGPFGVTPVEMARYFFAVFLVRQFTMVWVIWEFETDVVEGRLSPYLLQPMDPVWRHVASHIGERLTRIPVVVVFIVLFFALYPQAIWVPSIKALTLGVGAAILALVMRFIIQYTFALLSFWTERASAVEQLWYLFYLFLSGLIAPLDVYPPAIRELAGWTPFPYFVYVPAKLLTGGRVDLVKMAVVLPAWTIGFFVLNRWMWRRGLRHYSSMGA